MREKRSHRVRTVGIILLFGILIGIGAAGVAGFDAMATIEEMH